MADETSPRIPSSSPRPEAPTAVGVIETDAFCDACGFNLHTQKVWRDERLGIAVCRCPECGKHAPAGAKTTSATPWLSRLAIAGLTLWLVIALLFTVASFFTFFGNNEAAVELMVTTDYESRDGTPVYYNSIPSTVPSQGGPVMAWTTRYYFNANAGQEIETVPSDQVVHRTKFIPIDFPWAPVPPTTQYNVRRTPLMPLILLATIFATATFAIGCIASAGAWFWHRGRRWAWLVLPPLALLLSFSMHVADRQPPYAATVPREGEQLVHLLLLGVMVGQILVLGLGLLVGRPFVRLLLSVFIPPKARQLFAFLWHCDGKTMPSRGQARG